MVGTSQIGSALGSALLNQIGVPGPIGALIISSIFPSGGVPSYFDEVYQQITQIVTQALADEDISKVNDAINGINHWVSASYLTSKADPKFDRTQLNQDLEQQSDTFYDNIEILRDPARGTPGFPVFLVAASTHIALLQECAITDPNHPDDDAWNSRFVGEIGVNLTDYIGYAQATWPSIMTARLACISINRRDVTAPHFVDVTWTVTDSLTGEEQTFDSNEGQGGDDADAAAADMKSRASAALVQSLGDPDAIIAGWQALSLSPLPLESMASITKLVGEHSIGPFPWGNCDVYTIAWETAGGAQDVSFDFDGDAVAPSGKRSYVLGSAGVFSSDPLSNQFPQEIIAFDAHNKRVSQLISYAEIDWDPAGPVAKHQFDLGQGISGATQTFDWPATPA